MLLVGLLQVFDATQLPPELPSEHPLDDPDQISRERDY
jgi:hypothetical protein